MTGIIIKGIGGFYYVPAEDGIIYECKARGKFRKMGITPAVGDRVKITVANANPPEAAIDEIFPRKNILVRPPVANIDAIVTVLASKSPSPDYLMTDKLITMALKQSIEVIIAVNKTDLAPADEIFEVYKNSGCSVIEVCAAKNEGIDKLKAMIKGKTTAFAGNSGVGKSSILNCLGFDLKTGEVSKIERGKHTTRHVELMLLGESTYVMDTPGFSLLELFDVSKDELFKYFKEFEKYSDGCRFSDCMHFGTKPSDCGVAKAVANGDISEKRYNSYCELYDGLKDIKEY